MKALLLPLLAANLALQPGTALQCYSCEDQGNNEGCQRAQNQCWTERVEAIGLLTVISKGCSSHCVEDSGNSFRSKKNVACCSPDLCNTSRAQALQQRHLGAAQCSWPSAALGLGPAVGSGRTLLSPVPGRGCPGPRPLLTHLAQSQTL